MMMIFLRRSQSKPQEICLSFPCFSVPTPMLTPTRPLPRREQPGGWSGGHHLPSADLLTSGGEGQRLAQA